MNNLTILGNSEPKSISEQFQDLLENYHIPEEEKMKLVSHFKNNQEWYTRNTLKEVFKKYQIDEKESNSFVEEFIKSKSISGKFQDLLENYQIPEKEKMELVSHFKNNQEWYTRNTLKEIFEKYQIDDEDSNSFVEEFIKSKPIAGKFQDLLQRYWVSQEEEKKLLDEFRERNAGYTPDELEKIFDKYQVNITDRYCFSKENSKMREEELRKGAMTGAIAAIMARNQSHSLWRNMLLSQTDPDFAEFVQFCNPDFKVTKQGENRYHELFMQDYLTIKDHPFNLHYQVLRQEGKTVIEALQELPRLKEAERNMVDWGILPTNEETVQGSKMGNLTFCMGRINTILGILALNEGVEYVNQHVTYAEVIKDWLEDILPVVTSVNQRDISYLKEALNYEDPHHSLIIEENGNEIEIEPNHIAVQQMWRSNRIEDEVIKYEGRTSDIAYEIYYLNYLNEKLQKNPDVSNREEILERIENLNLYLWWSEVLTKWLLSHALYTGKKERIIKFNQELSTLVENYQWSGLFIEWLLSLLSVDREKTVKYRQELDELAEKYPSIKNKYAYQFNKDPENIDTFIHRKYGPQFSRSDVDYQYGIEEL